MSEKYTQGERGKLVGDSVYNRAYAGKIALRNIVVSGSVGLALLFGSHEERSEVHISEHAVTKVSYDATGAEKSWCKWPSRWKLCVRVMDELAPEALQAAAQIGADTGRSLHNGSADAFRHCYWSARMTEEFGYDTSKGFGDRHENSDAQPNDEKEMDLYNNEIGRQIGVNESDVYGSCKTAMEEGRLTWLAPHK